MRKACDVAASYQTRSKFAWFQASAGKEMRTALFWVITQRVVVISYRESHLQVPSLKMWPLGCPETSVRNYHYSSRNNPKERGSHLDRNVSLYCGDKTYKLTDKRDLQVVLLLFIVSAETCERTVCEREREREREGGGEIKSFHKLVCTAWPTVWRTSGRRTTQIATDFLYCTPHHESCS